MKRNKILNWLGRVVVSGTILGMFTAQTAKDFGSYLLGVCIAIALFAWCLEAFLRTE